MLTVGRRRTARLAATALVSGLLAVAGAGSAVADGGAAPTAGGAQATFTSIPQNAETATIHEDGGDEHVDAALLQLTVTGGGTLYTYCIDIKRPTLVKSTYQEAAWKDSVLDPAGKPNPDAGKIEWILQNSYPRVDDLAKLGDEAGVKGLTALDAQAGTQVAIWTYSDHVKVTADGDNAEKLAQYLVSSAQSLGEPAPSLTATPANVAGMSGTKVGPVTVHTNGGSAQVALAAGAPAGVKLVDAAGKPVSTAADGAQLYFDVPAGADAGSATLQVQSTTTVPVGRVFDGFLPPDPQHPDVKTAAQSLILAGSSASTVSAQATASWAPKGPVPALNAAVDCAKGGVDLSAVNSGDQPFVYTVGGKQYTVAPGKTATVFVPETEGKAYSIPVTGSNGYKQTFTGLLNCKVTTSTGGVSTTPSGSPAPAPAAQSGGTNLAETGASSSTPIIAGIAIVLVLAGGGTVFFLRKRKAGSGS